MAALDDDAQSVRDRVAKAKYHESCPVWMAVLSVTTTLLIYVLGVLILLQASIILAMIYILYCVWVELRVLSKSCVNCCYYGRVCGLGRSIMCTLLFKQGDPEKFLNRKISWLQVLPDLLVTIIPLLVGVVLLITHFWWFTLFLMIVLFLLSFVGTAILRGSLTCKYCKQRELGCPAEQLFSKKK